MPYTARLRSSYWTLLAPDGSVVGVTERSYPFDSSDVEIWVDIVSHARNNLTTNRAIANVAAGMEQVDERQ